MIMTTKIEKTIYRISVALTSVWFATSGILELAKNAFVWGITLSLGYPPYFIYLLGTVKLSGVAVLLVPGKLLRLKEWVFAGMFFDIAFAFASNLIVVGFSAVGDALVAFVLVLVTYIMFRRVYIGASSPFAVASSPFGAPATPRFIRRFLAIQFPDGR